MNFECRICGKKNEIRNKMYTHINKEHNLKKEEYILKYYYNNQNPLCKCGCGEETSFSQERLEYPFYRDYIPHHHLKGKKRKEESVKKGMETAKKNNLEKYNVEYTITLPEVRAKTKKTNLERYDNEIYDLIYLKKSRHSISSNKSSDEYIVVFKK